MKPETADALLRAHRAISKAEIMLAHDFPDEAGRLAYVAGLSAASGFIFERTGHVVKTHSGTQSEFSRLTRGDTAFEDRHRRFLGQTYALKASADYGIGPAAGIDDEVARHATGLARSFVAAIEAALDTPRAEGEFP